MTASIDRESMSAGPAGSAYVFLSYASVDRERVWPIVSALESAGIPVWIDKRSIPGSAVYGPEIVSGIESCTAFLVCCSETSLSSWNVRQEIRLAWSYRRPYLPLMFEQVRIPRDLEYWLAYWQRIDILDRPPEQWLPKLLEAVRRLLYPETDDDRSRPHVPVPASAISNLPVPPTPLIGRASELETLNVLLGEPEARAITLTGPGGIGKTRLALQAAMEARARFPDGVFLCDLAEATEIESVYQVISEKLGVHETGNQSLRDTILSFLIGKRVLLILDNCETARNAAPAIGDLLAACPQLVVLATSRTPLKLMAEREFPVPVLTVPPDARSMTLEALRSTEAVALFIDRARAIMPNFDLTARNRDAVVEICTRLDGLPLAIELAAARIKLLGPEAIAARLDRRLALLTSGRSDAPLRHRTLSAAIEWSYDLLSPDEQRLLRRLAVFPSGWTIDSATDVLGAVGGDSPDVFEGLATLADHSLIVQSPESGSEPRFEMLQTIREFGFSRLEAAGETEPLQRSLANWALALTERAAPLLDGPEQIEWLGRLSAEHDTIRFALQFGKETDPALVPRLVVAMRRFWQLRGFRQEAAIWIETALASEARPSPELEAWLLIANAAALDARGEMAAEIEILERVVASGRTMGDVAITMAALLDLGAVCLEQGQLTRAAGYLQECIALARQSGDRRQEAMAAANLGAIAQYRGDLETAAGYLEESLRTFRELGNVAREAEMLMNLMAIVAPDPDQRDRVEALDGELAPLIAELGDRELDAYAHTMRGIAADARGDFELAEAMHHKSLMIFRELEEPAGIATALGNSGLAALELGKIEDSVQYGVDSLRIAQQIGDTDAVGYSLEGLAFTFCATGRLELAATLLGAVEGLRKAIGVSLPAESLRRHRRAIQTLERDLESDVRIAAWNAGRSLEIEAAIQQALVAANTFSLLPRHSEE